MPEEELFFGKHKIVNVEDMLDGRKRVELKYAEPKDMPDGSKETGEKIITEDWELTVCATKVPGDESDVRNLRAIYVVDKIYDVLKELNVYENEIVFITQKLLGKLQGVEKKALQNLYGLSDLNELRIADWEKNQ